MNKNGLVSIYARQRAHIFDILEDFLPYYLLVRAQNEFLCYMKIVCKGLLMK